MKKLLPLATLILFIPHLVFATAKAPTGQVPNLPPLQQIDFGVEPNYSHNIQTEDNSPVNDQPATHSTEQSIDNPTASEQQPNTYQQPTAVSTKKNNGYSWLVYLSIFFILSIGALLLFRARKKNMSNNNSSSK